ncbi:prevent-host-death family protein [Colwellia chukchiensis]|uniref:Antitoxin n=1 Tax=Colwellia chukchiensis TaxID=641665 RepID=A0A1H7I2K7_9GAMM|nr:type II toxin-antitoxin system Phd/YefM family antitoxin [Colwellia chukchiensis]SEK56082.1 prevent-host-death family protein [Colwellia chukchiensis]
MLTLDANEAKTNFGQILLKVQSEPIEIKKNGNPVAVILSSEEYSRIEELKMELVRSRFENIDEIDLMDGNDFIDGLDSGKYD